MNERPPACRRCGHHKAHHHRLPPGRPLRSEERGPFDCSLCDCPQFVTCEHRVCRIILGLGEGATAGAMPWPAGATIHASIVGAAPAGVSVGMRWCCHCGAYSIGLDAWEYPDPSYDPERP